ncbi:zinc finger protein 83-like [Planococcus citri]|uniref:zinc finger protein 83-like n=1 Tax=Planococcus citri TaxID=170843 RepID=UPI0031F9A541
MDPLSENNSEEGIALNETIIKMEPEDDTDTTMDSTGNFLTVLVPEDNENTDTKPTLCACGNIIELDPLNRQNTPSNGVLRCNRCLSLNSSSIPTSHQQSRKVLLNAITNAKNTLPFRCHYCSKTYDAKETFYNHIRMHAMKKKNPYLCGMCGKNFKELLQFKKHICARNVLKCNKCSKQFESIFRLENHYLTHSKYKCDECGKCLSSKTVLEEHKRVHTNEYPFKCDRCNRQFRQKSKYNAHTAACKDGQNINKTLEIKAESIFVD